MLARDFRSADPHPFEPDGIDQASCRIPGWILEGAAEAALLDRLGGAPVLLDFQQSATDRLWRVGAGPEGRAQDYPGLMLALESRVTIAEPAVVGRQRVPLAGLVQDLNRLEGILDFPTERAGVSKDGSSDASRHAGGELESGAPGPGGLGGELWHEGPGAGDHVLVVKLELGVAHFDGEA